VIEEITRRILLWRQFTQNLQTVCDTRNELAKVAGLGYNFISLVQEYMAGTTVEITMNDGRHLTKHVEYPRGEPENPFTEQDHLNKLTWMATHLGMKQSKIDKLTYTLERLEELPNITELNRLLVHDGV